MLLTNISHVERWWVCYQDIICGKSKIQRKSSHIDFVDDGKGTMGKPDRDKYLLLPFSSAHFCSRMKQGLGERVEMMNGWKKRKALLFLGSCFKRVCPQWEDKEFLPVFTSCESDFCLLLSYNFFYFFLVKISLVFF